MLAELPVDLIDASDRLRQINEDQVAAIAASVADVGLLNPITVASARVMRAGILVDGYRLVAGLHRLEVVRRAGWVAVPAQIVNLSDLQRQIAECDENLCATKLTPSERALFTRRRKEAYEALHPEARQGATGGTNAGKGRSEVAKLATSVDRFTADTAVRTGRSERDVQRDATRGERIDEAVLAEIVGTDLDKGSVLDALAQVPKGEQAEKVKEIATQRRGAMSRVPDEKAHWQRDMEHLWSRGKPAWQAEWLAEKALATDLLPAP